MPTTRSMSDAEPRLVLNSPSGSETPAGTQHTQHGPAIIPKRDTYSDRAAAIDAAVAKHEKEFTRQNKPSRPVLKSNQRNKFNTRADKVEADAIPAFHARGINFTEWHKIIQQELIRRGANNFLTSGPGPTTTSEVSHHRSFLFLLYNAVDLSLLQFDWGSTSVVASFAKLVRCMPRADSVIADLESEATFITITNVED